MTDPGPRGLPRAVAGLSRRVRTLIVSGLLFFVLLILALTLSVPYVILSPGPTVNTLGTYDVGNGNQADVIAIDGRNPNKTTGNLNLTTVNVSSQKLTVFDTLSAWLQSDQVVVPRSSVILPGQSEEQTQQQNAADFTSSQDNAIAAASCQLGYPKRFGVVGVLSDGAAAKVLDPADVLETLNGTEADTATSLTSQLSKLAPGTKIALGIEREGKPRTVSITLGPATSQRTGGTIGITVGTVCQLPFTVDLGLGNEIGGPSAGLMFALGIMDKVGKIDLTHGRFVAGTGEITSTGQVQPIGGIQLKMIAARNAGATLFLAPAGNCADVDGAIPAGLDVVKVHSLSEAVQYLQATEQHKSVPHC